MAEMCLRVPLTNYELGWGPAGGWKEGEGEEDCSMMTGGARPLHFPLLISQKKNGEKINKTVFFVKTRWNNVKNIGYFDFLNYFLPCSKSSLALVMCQLNKGENNPGKLSHNL